MEGIRMNFEPQIIELDGYLAAADPMTGGGYLAFPRASEDVLNPFYGDGRTLHDALFPQIVSQLDVHGIEPSTDDESGDGFGLVYESPLPDGRPVIGLLIREPIMASAALDECASALAACRAALDAATLAD